MSPLKIALLLRAHTSPRPNGSLPSQEAYAQSMSEAIAEFRNRGVLDPDANTNTARYGTPDGRSLLTDKGRALVWRVMGAAAEFYKEAA